MKTQFLFLFVILSFAFISCNKEDTGPELRKAAEEKVMGRWNLEKTVRQEYNPIPILKSTEVNAATAEDHYVFKSNGMVEINAAPAARTEVNFEVINPNQMWLNDQSWWITELTATKLVLKKDRYDGANNQRHVTVIQFKR